MVNLFGNSVSRYPTCLNLFHCDIPCFHSCWCLNSTERYVPQNTASIKAWTQRRTILLPYTADSPVKNCEVSRRCTFQQSGSVGFCSMLSFYLTKLAILFAVVPRNIKHGLFCHIIVECIEVTLRGQIFDPYLDTRSPNWSNYLYKTPIRNL